MRNESRSTVTDHGTDAVLLADIMDELESCG